MKWFKNKKEEKEKKQLLSPMERKYDYVCLTMEHHPAAEYLFEYIQYFEKFIP